MLGDVIQSTARIQGEAERLAEVALSEHLYVVCLFVVRTDAVDSLFQKYPKSNTTSLNNRQIVCMCVFIRGAFVHGIGPALVLMWP